MTYTMRALRVHAWNTTPTVGEVPVPVRAEGETLIRVEAAAVGHLDLTVASGTFGITPDLPYVPGTDGSGVVVESDTFQPGTRVTMRGTGIGLTRPGSWAEQISVPDRGVRAVTPGLSAELAATYFVPTTTAWTALHEIAHLGDDEHVVVAGAAGAVGAMVVQMALLSGARVTALVATEEQKSLVPVRATAITIDDVDPVAQLASERSATLLVDTIGGEQLSERAKWVGAGGRAALIGYVAGTSVTLDLPNWLLEDVAFLPVNMIRRDRTSREMAPRMAEMLLAGDIHLDVESFGFGQVDEAISRLRSGGLRGRAVLDATL